MFGLTEFQIILLVVTALLVGLTNAGFVGITLPAIALLAISFGAKASSGIMLTLLIAGDIISVIMYGKKCNFKDLLKVMHGFDRRNSRCDSRYVFER